jgi:hypothetical protein
MLKTILAFSTTDYKKNPKFYNRFIAIIEKINTFKIIYKWYEGKEPKNSAEVYSIFLKEIKNSDLIIAEASSPSIGVGQTITVANQNMKNILICIKKNIKMSNLHPLITGITSSFVRYLYYDDFSDLNDKLINISINLNKLKFKKFNFLATEEIKNLLKEESRKLNITQSELLRNIIMDWSGRKTHQ